MRILHLFPFSTWKKQKGKRLPESEQVDEVEERLPPVIPEMPELILPAPPQVKKPKPRTWHRKRFRPRTHYEILKRAGTGEENWELFDEVQIKGSYGRYTMIKLRNKLTQEIHVEIFKE